MDIKEIIIFILAIISLIVWFVWLYISSKARNNKLSTRDDKLLMEKLNNIDQSLQKQMDLVINNQSGLVETREKITSNTKFVDTLVNSLNDLKNQDLRGLNENQQAVINNIIALSNEIKNNTKESESIKDNINKINDIFFNFKRRGSVGELILETILINILGKDDRIWESQYELFVENNKSEKGRVDFVVHTPKENEDIIIDSKFPLETYNKICEVINNKDSLDEFKNLKNQFETSIFKKVQEVAKYINPKNNISSAILFVPSDAVFNFIVDNYNDLVQKANNMNVWIVSPSLIIPMISIILRFTKDYKIAENLNKFKSAIVEIKNEYAKFNDRFLKLKKDFENVNADFKKTEITINKIIDKTKKVEDAKFD